MDSVPTETTAAPALGEREAIDDRFKWKLTHIFSDWDAWKAGYDELEIRIAAYAALQGTLAEGPDRLRGRMMGINMVFFAGGPQLGELEAGLVAHSFGAPVSVVSGGIGCLLATAWVALATPALRLYGKSEISERVNQSTGQSVNHEAHEGHEAHSLKNRSS